MKIEGRRADGAMLLSIGGGAGVIMRGQYATRPCDIEQLAPFGPWAPVENTTEARAAASRALDRTQVTPLSSFQIAKV